MHQKDWLQKASRLEAIDMLSVMARENPISENHEGESIDAQEGGGSSCSSDEGPVMGLERRG